jgi:hypothetical protein
MKILTKLGAIFLGLVALILVHTHMVGAQALVAAPQITFNSFSGTYHLSRDSAGRSLLTTEEVILADFPANGQFYGITRAIPKSYQNHSVEVKVLSITDVAGNDVPYTTSSDKNSDLVISTGDKGITIYGLQTYRISYQTRGVINLNTSQNQFLLDVNGRGWSQTIGQVSGVIHIPSSFSSNLTSKPSCYIGYLNTSSLNCSISTQKKADETIITSKALGPVAPQHALVVKVNFKLATFSAPKPFWTSSREALVGIGLIMISMTSLWIFKNRH